MQNPSLKSSMRLWAVAFLFLLTLIVIRAVPTRAAPRSTITVTNPNDSGTGSLRDAIVNALPDDTIVFSLTLPATITLSSQLEITNSLTISGPGASLLAISGNYTARVMTITAGITLRLSGVTITEGQIYWMGSAIYNGGMVTVTGSTFSSNSGGPIWNTGTLDITDSTFTGNHSIFSSSAIDNDGVLTVANSTFSGNSSYGPPIGNAGLLTITHSKLSGNYGRSAGGIGNNGTLVMSDSTLSSNIGWIGGGISNGGTLTVANSTFSGNLATTTVGLGGGIHNSGIATIANSTFYSNTASYQGLSQGGGLYNRGGTMNVTNSTLSSNSANSGGGLYLDPCCGGLITLKNTIVANSASGGNCGGIIIDAGNNIDDGMTCGWGLPGSSNGSMMKVNPLLGPLANNGGPTQTFALLPGSPAIDGVIFNAPNGCPPTDQRGATRPIGPRCDIGAYEASYLFLPLILR